MSTLNHERLVAILTLALFLAILVAIAEISGRRVDRARHRTRMYLRYFWRRRMGAPFDHEYEEDWR